MLIIDDIISNAVVSDMAKVLYGDMIKAVADVEDATIRQRIMDIVYSHIK